MYELPLIKIELDGMRYSIVHALSTHNAEIETYVDENLKKVVEEFDYVTLVKQVATKAITEAVKRSIESYFAYGDGYKNIDAVITEILKNHAG